eukprot:m.84873 g.84873  ORF g.84873 m.84873 type:complete len:1140 (-) comp25818_c2_seq1:55-3474(-)
MSPTTRRSCGVMILVVTLNAYSLLGSCLGTDSADGCLATEPSTPEGTLKKLGGGVWRTVGIENKASGKFEFDQIWGTASATYESTADASWYPYTTCHAVTDGGPDDTHMTLLNCTHKGGNVNQHCIVDFLEGFHSVDVAFVACNHSGFPGPTSYEQAMNTPPDLGNFYMVRCKPGTSPFCNFTAIETGVPVSDAPSKPENSCSKTVISAPPGVPELLQGSWRAMEISQEYTVGVAQWNFTSGHKATLEWPNYKERPLTHYDVFSHSNMHVVLKNVETGGVRTCLFDAVVNDIVTYSIFTCGAEGALGPKSVVDGLRNPNIQYTMARCNRGSDFCEWSFGPSIDGPQPPYVPPTLALSSRHREAYPPRGQPCATTGQQFQPTREARMQCTVGTPGEFTDYLFETQFTSCTPGVRTLHGMWPDYGGENKGGYPWPQFCSSTPFNISDITNVPGLKEKMDKFWPSCPPHGIPNGRTQEQANIMFWEHEWERHGSCAPANYGVAGYFATALAVLESMPSTCTDCKDEKCGCHKQIKRSDVDQLYTKVSSEHITLIAESKRKSHGKSFTDRKWCQTTDTCWPTKAEVAAFRAKLNPTEPRDLNWKGYPEEGQPSAVPIDSSSAQVLYGVGDNATHIHAMYTNNNPAFVCYTQPDQELNNVGEDHCKAATRNQPYNNWEPAFIVFAQREEHLQVALQFAVDHSLCVMVAGTGHEYLNRHSCPSGGVMIRTTAMQDQQFLPRWDADPSGSPQGAFKFSPGLTFSGAHKFAADNNRVISSGWCVTVGLIGWSLGGGHGPLAPSIGLGVDNTLEFTVLQVDEGNKVVKRTVSATENSDLLWAMKGGGGSVWGIVSSITVRAHAIPEGGFTRYFVESDGDFCGEGEGTNPHNWQFLQDLNQQYATWMLTLNSKFAIQASIWPKIEVPGQGCTGSWSLRLEYFYAGSKHEPAAVAAYHAVTKFMEPDKDNSKMNTVTSFANFFEYVSGFKGDQFALRPAPAAVTNNINTGAQSSVLVPREKLATEWPAMFNDILSRCPSVGRCPFQFMYLGFTGNIDSPQPAGTALSPGMRTYAMAHNARELTELELNETLYTLSNYSYFSESPYYMHNWGDRYWGSENFAQLQDVKQKYDPLNIFWCHHCIGDNPDSPN